MKFDIDNGVITTESVVFGTEKYKLCSKAPERYEVWNIGDNMGSSEYVPFCILKPNGYEIDVDTLIAVRMMPSEVRVIRKAASYGVTSLKKAERIVSCGLIAVCSDMTMDDDERISSVKDWEWALGIDIMQTAREALPIYKKYTGQD